MHVENVRNQLKTTTGKSTTPQDAKMPTPRNFISDLRLTWGANVRVIGVLVAECQPFGPVWPGCSLFITTKQGYVC